MRILGITIPGTTKKRRKTKKRKPARRRRRTPQRTQTGRFRKR